MRAMGAPAGVVTFLFTDIEGRRVGGKTMRMSLTASDMATYARAGIDMARTGLEIP